MWEQERRGGFSSFCQKVRPQQEDELSLLSTHTHVVFILKRKTD